MDDEVAARASVKFQGRFGVVMFLRKNQQNRQGKSRKPESNTIIMIWTNDGGVQLW